MSNSDSKKGSMTIAAVVRKWMEDYGWQEVVVVEYHKDGSVIPMLRAIEYWLSGDGPPE